MNRIGIIGCGAVTEQLHLPPLQARADCRITALVDRDPRRLQAVGRLAPHARTAERYQDALGDFDLALLALPHNLHAPVASDLLRAGKCVLVEKPMALTSAECDQMVAAAAHPWSLTIGQMRRFCPAVAMAAELLRKGTIGAVREVDVRDGVVFGWPLESDFQFRKDKSGGGVLVDTGAHALDMVIGWFGEPSPVSYRDDSLGGVEADCVAELTFGGTITCRVELSRTRNLRNSAIIRGERGSIDVAFYDNKLTLALAGAPAFVMTPAAQLDVWRQMFDLQLDDWLGAIREHRAPRVPGTEGRKVVRLIESLYAIRRPLAYPWEQYAAASAAAALSH